MKNIQTILLGILLLAVGVLYFLHFKTTGSVKSEINKMAKDSALGNKPTEIAYFEMDSIQNKYQYIVNVRNSLKAKEQSMTNELNNMKKSYQSMMQTLQLKAKNMTQEEGERAQQAIYEEEKKIRDKEAGFSQEMQAEQFRQLQDINKQIEDFLKDFNKDKKYAYILSHQSSDNMYYKNNAFDITNKLIDGLNAEYAKKQKK